MTGLLVAVAPRLGAHVVAAWLAGIVVNLLTVDSPTYFDIALRDFGLLLAALALGRLAASSARRAPSAEAEVAGTRPVRDLVRSRCNVREASVRRFVLSPSAACSADGRRAPLARAPRHGIA
jgi:hypothetical protein